jgi:uncharacterized membrane protein
MKKTTLISSLILFGLGNKLFGIWQTIPMYNYPFVLGFWTLSIYVTICASYVIPMIMYGSSITEEMRNVPKYKFAIMGTLDGFSALMGQFATNYIAKKSLVPLLQQASIPLSMLFSKMLIKETRYNNANYVGAIIVVLGLVTVLFPEVMNEHSKSLISSNSENYENEDGSGSLKVIVWSIVLVLGCVPSVLSSVYKEITLNEVTIDTMYINFWIAVIQALTNMPMIVPSAAISGIPIKDIPENMKNGFECVWGHNSITDPSYTNSSIEPLRVDNCGMAPVYINLFILFNFVYNMFLIYTIRDEGSNILWIALTVIVPLTQIILWIPGVPGHHPASVFDIMGFMIVLVGLFIYRSDVEYIVDNMINIKHYICSIDLKWCSRRHHRSGIPRVMTEPLLNRA